VKRSESRSIYAARHGRELNLGEMLKLNADIESTTLDSYNCYAAPIDRLVRRESEILSIVVDEEYFQAATSWDLTPSMN
jgi:hypothetical protein